MSTFPNFLFLLCVLISSLLAQNPTCTVDSTAFSSQIPPPLSNNYLLSPNNESILGTNYGKLISVGSRIWLMQSPFIMTGSYTLLKDPCPQGWMLPTSQDLTNLVAAVGSNPAAVLTNSSLFNMKTTRYYLSSTKTYPTYNTSSVAQSWVFNGLQFLATGKAQVGPINSYYMASTISAFCVLKRNNETTTPGTAGISVKGIDSKDLIKGLKYVLSINNTNILDNTWNLDGGQNTSHDLNLIPMKEGSFNLNYKIMLFDGSLLGDCRVIWVRNYTGSEANTNFTVANLFSVSYPFFKYRNIGLFFNSGSAPMAPKDDGGAYIMYAEANVMYLHVLTIDSNGQQISDFNLTKSGFPFSIISVGWGWVALIKDFQNPDYLYLLGVDTNNNIVFNRTLINSNSAPTNYTSDQLIFFQDAKGTPAFGMNAMFDPSSGRLAMGKNRIAVHFAHYNFFGYLSDGTRNDHTGDTLFTVNMKGQDEKISFSWGASHSLTQNLFYNGDRFMSAALGDAYPMNVFFSTVDGLNPKATPDPTTGLYNILNYQQTMTLLPDIITGDGGGFANGRLGNILELSDGQTFVFSYARRKSWTTFLGTNYSSLIDELGLSFFDKNLNLLKDVSLLQGQWVNQVQSCRYGKNIFISYVISNKHLILNNTFLEDTLSPDDVQYFILVDEQGNLLNGPLLLQAFMPDLPASDEIKMMADGRCAWTVVDSSGILNYVFLTPPDQTPTNFADVQSSQFYNGGDFYLINQYDLNSYKMATVDANNQTLTSFIDVGTSNFGIGTSDFGMVESALRGQIRKTKHKKE